MTNRVRHGLYQGAPHPPTKALHHVKWERARVARTHNASTHWPIGDNGAAAAAPRSSLSPPSSAHPHPLAARRPYHRPPRHTPCHKPQRPPPPPSPPTHPPPHPPAPTPPSPNVPSSFFSTSGPRRCSSVARASNSLLAPLAPRRDMMATHRGQAATDAAAVADAASATKLRALPTGMGSHAPPGRGAAGAGQRQAAQANRADGQTTAQEQDGPRGARAPTTAGRGVPPAGTATAPPRACLIQAATPPPRSSWQRPASAPARDDAAVL